MSFTLDWLDLREPADRAARDRKLLTRAQGYLAAANALAVDLGTGTGAMVRAFAGNPRARWQLIDNDPDLLAIAANCCGERATTLLADLRDIDALPLAGARLVTASALFDLTGANWIAALVKRLAVVGAGLYAALTYDGRLTWEPADGEDEAVTIAFNRHQRTDKGFGPALGPQAGACLAEALHNEGFRVWTTPSPWRLGPSEAVLQRALLTGIAQAAAQTEMDGADRWCRRREAALSSGSLLVGHVDILALPVAKA